MLNTSVCQNTKPNTLLKSQIWALLHHLLLAIQCPHCSVYHSGTALCMISCALK